MRLIIHDLEETFNNKIKKYFQDDSKNIHIISDNNTIKHCIGCFGCFVKTPGKCILKDNYNMMGALCGQTDELIIISKCIYGTYSPFISNVLNRNLGYIHPDFTKRNGEIHHKLRYKNSMKTTVYFYGDVSSLEKDTATKLVTANLLNFNGTLKRIEFLDTTEDLFK